MRPPRRLAVELLEAASRGEEKARTLIRKRVEFLHASGRAGLADLMGQPLAEYEEVKLWLEWRLRTSVSAMGQDGVSAEAQCWVFEMVYPLVARLPEVRSRAVWDVSRCPRLLEAALRLGRELLGAPNVNDLRSPSGEKLSPFLTLDNEGDLSKPMWLRIQQCVDLLVGAGANMEIRGEGGGTPLQMVARNDPGNLPLMAALLRRGANVKAFNSWNGNILHCLVVASMDNPDDIAVLRAYRFLERRLSDDTMRELLAGGSGPGDRPYDMTKCSLHYLLLEKAKALGLPPVASL